MWNLLGSGMERMSPAMTGGFFTPEPPGRPSRCFVFAFYSFFFNSLMYFNSKLTGTAQKTDNIKNMYLHVGQLS